MNEPNLPSFPEKKNIKKEIPSIEIADAILEHGITKKGGKYYTKIPYKDVLTTVTLSEESLDSLYSEYVSPRFSEVSSSFTDAFLSYIHKNGQDAESERQTIVIYFKGLIGLLDLIEKNPRPSYDMRDKHNNCEKFLRFAFEYESKYESSTSPLIDSICGKHGHYLLSYLAQHQILPQNYFDIDKRFLHLSLILQEHSIEELVDYNKKGYISRDNLSLFLSSEELLSKYRSSKNTKYLRALSSKELIGLYLNESISFSEIKEARISQNDFYNLIINRDISIADLILLARNSDFEKLFPSSDKLLKLYNQFALGGKAILELVTLGKVNPEAIPNLYAKEQVLQNAIIVPEAFDEEYLTTDEDFRQMFSIDFMLRLEKNGDFTPELVDFYKSTIVPSREEGKKEFYLKRCESLKEIELTTDNIPTLLALVEKGIFSIDDISALDIDESDFSLDGLSCQRLCILYSAGKISEINLLDMSPSELIACWKKGILIENAIDILNPPDFEDAYSKGNIECKDMLHLFGANKIELKNLDCLDQSELQETILQMNILSNDEENNALIEDRFISPEKIAELFLNNKIDYDTFAKLRTDGKISEEVYTASIKAYSNKIAELFLNKCIDYDTFTKLYAEGKISEEVYTASTDAYNIKGEMEVIQKLFEIQNTAVPNGQNVPSYPLPLSGTTHTARKVSINPELRNDFLETLGSENPLLITTGALKGYMFIPIPNLKTVVLEKLYNANSRTGALTPALDNATFVLPFIKALELAQNSNKTDLRQLDNVFPVPHTKNWGLNVLKAISKGNPRFEYKRYKEDYSYFIDLISQNYMENRGE